MMRQTIARAMTHAKKESGLDDLFKEYTPQQLEEVRNIPVAASSVVQDAISKYEKFGKSQVIHYPGYNVVKPLELKKIILSPDDINLVIKKIIAQDKKEDYLGLFSSWLIQNSYDAGHNGFFLDFSNAACLYRYVGSFLGYPEEQHPTQRIFITVRGDVGRNFADVTAAADFTIDGAIQGTPLGGKNCIFRTPNPATARYLNQHLPRGNKIVRICPDGTTIDVRDFHDRDYY